MNDTIFRCLAYVGFYALSCYLYDNLKSPLLLLYRRVLHFFFNRKNNSLLEKYGKWAVITGSSDGIGRAYARELARHGLNVILISRTETKLKQVAKEIENEFGVQTKIIVADFTEGEAVYKHIEKELGDTPVGILVNNVGRLPCHYGILSSYPAKEVWDLIYVNIAPVMLLSRLFLHRMQSAGIKGAIVNISSIAELVITPYSGTYSAAKAFTRSLTLALQEEAAYHGITVQLVSPSAVATKLMAFAKFECRKRLFIPDPETFARSAVSTIGVVDETSGYHWHAVQTAIIKLLPWRMTALIVARLQSAVVNNGIRKSA